MKSRKAIPKALRKQIVEEADKCCHYCGRKITSKRGRQLDHKRPHDESDPNTNSKSNLVLSCKICNTAKSTTSYGLFILKRWKYARKMLATLEKRLEELK